MDKEKLLTFIDKYNLGGSVPSVKLTSDGTTLKTNFVSEDKTLAGNVTLKSCDIPKSELAIFNTDDFRGLIRVLSDSIKIELNELDGRPVGLSLIDDNQTINFVLSDATVIPKAPAVKAPKDFDVEIPIDDKFIDLFVSAKNALSVVDSFTLLMGSKSKKLEIVVGYSSINSNRITVNVNPVSGKDTVSAPISFNANYMKEILNRNKEATGAVFKVSQAGIASLAFSTPDFDANYFLIKKEIES